MRNPLEAVQYTRTSDLRNQIQDITEKAVGLVTAPLFFATTIHFPTKAIVDRVRLSIDKNRPKASLTSGALSIPTGGLASIVINGCRVFVSDQDKDTHPPQGQAIVMWRSDNPTGDRIGRRVVDSSKVIVGESIQIDGGILVAHTPD